MSGRPPGVALPSENLAVTSIADSQVVTLTMPTTAPPPAPSPLAAPQVTATVLSSTTADLSWNRVSGAQGYRIYWMNGTQKVLLGTVGSRATGVEIVGMTASSTFQFIVEAYSVNLIADSALVTVTTPAKQAGQGGWWSSTGQRPRSLDVVRR